MENVTFRRAEPQDFPGILKIQSANYVANLSAEERKEGFLSAEFTPEQIAEMAQDLGIIIAGEAGSVLGYLCGFRNDFNHGSPVLVKMLESYDRIHYEGKPLSDYRSFVYGPVCIDRASRRRGLLRGLYEALKNEVAGKFEVGVAFVARDNTHSLRAHVDGLGMADVGDFEVKGKVYAILAFSVPSKALPRLG
jgi:predicted GNAT superfamily acetyltransferase